MKKYNVTYSITFEMAASSDKKLQDTVESIADKLRDIPVVFIGGEVQVQSIEPIGPKLSVVKN